MWPSTSLPHRAALPVVVTLAIGSSAVAQTVTTYVDFSAWASTPLDPTIRAEIENQDQLDGDSLPGTFVSEGYVVRTLGLYDDTNFDVEYLTETVFIPPFDFEEVPVVDPSTGLFVLVNEFMGVRRGDGDNGIRLNDVGASPVCFASRGKTVVRSHSRSCTPTHETHSTATPTSTG